MHILQAFVRLAKAVQKRILCCGKAEDDALGFLRDESEHSLEPATAALGGRPGLVSEATRLVPRRVTHRRSSSWWRKSETTPSLTSSFENYSHSQSAFWLCLAHGSAYYLAAVLGYHFYFDDIPLVDSLYFATSLFTTVGYGDIYPTSAGGQIFTMLLATYGVVILGIFIGIVGEMAVDLNAQKKRSRQKVIASKLLHSIENQGTTNGIGTETDSSQPDESQRRLLGNIWHIILMELPIVSVLVVVALVIGRVEGWTPLQSVYWLAISGYTIGTGDFTPSTTATKLICVFFLPLCVAVLGEILARIASLYMRRKHQEVEHCFLNRTLTLCDLRTLDADRNGSVDKAEFLTYMLVALQKVPREDIDEILTAFARLDKDGNGFLTEADLGFVRGSFRRSVATLRPAFSASMAKLLEEDLDDDP
jgi:Ion channel